MNIEQIDSAIESLEKLKREIVGDKFEDLKKAYSEGAIIEYKKAYPWDETINPTWHADYKYRIKDGISISSWNTHKDLIKQWWNGAEILYRDIVVKPTWDIIAEYKVKQDKVKDLKKAYSEGAIIEYWNTRTEEYLDGGSGMTWSPSSKYRIKDNISISSWNAHKDIIKQYWNGAEIERHHPTANTWDIKNSPEWHINATYRVKPNIWKLPEYEDGARSVVFGSNQVTHSDSKEFTSSGRRRATKELAERCAKASKTRDLLEAYRDYLEPDWADSNINKYYIYFSVDKYFVNYNISINLLGTVYGSKETMTQICVKLNTGEINFD